MDYNEFCPDWDCVDLPARAALDSRLADMVVQHIDEDAMWPQTVTGLASDLVANDEVRTVLTRVSILVGNMAVYMHGGRAEAIEALKRDRAQLRKIARNGYM